MSDFKLSETEIKIVQEAGAKGLQEWDRRLKLTNWKEEKNEVKFIVVYLCCLHSLNTYFPTPTQLGRFLLDDVIFYDRNN